MDTTLVLLDVLLVCLSLLSLLSCRLVHVRTGTMAVERSFVRKTRAEEEAEEDVPQNMAELFQYIDTEDGRRRGA